MNTARLPQARALSESPPFFSPRASPLSRRRDIQGLVTNLSDWSRLVRSRNGRASPRGSLAHVMLAYRSCVHIYYNTYTHRVARPFGVAAKAGTVRPASWDGMHRTQHKVPHSYTETDKNRQRRKDTDRENGDYRWLVGCTSGGWVTYGD